MRHWQAVYTVCMPSPLAYFLTWRSYGTWLPGDERGCVDPLHNVYDTPFAPPDEDRKSIAESSMLGAPFELGEEARAIVDQTVRDHCTIKKWSLHAVNVRTNHVHVVVSCGAFDPDMAMGQFKSWGTLDCGTQDSPEPGLLLGRAGEAHGTSGTKKNWPRWLIMC